MAKIDQIIAHEFTCGKCKHVGAHVERLAMSGTGISRMLEIQTYRYAFVSCLKCGFTEIYNLKILEGNDDLGTILEIITSN